jgi:hypothetical protein
MWRFRETVERARDAIALALADEQLIWLDSELRCALRFSNLCLRARVCRLFALMRRAAD